MPTKNAVAAPPDPNALTVGESSIPRQLATSSVITMTSQLLRLSYFTAQKTETITTLRVTTGGTGAGATPTLVRLGVYSVDPSTGDLTLIASTANDTTLLATPAGSNSKALSASWAKVAGLRYAVGLLVVTGATAPTIAANASALASTEIASAPKLACAVASQADLPASLASASQTASSSAPYVAMIP